MLNVTNWLKTGDLTHSRLNESWFPGRWVGGVSLLVAPLLLVAGVLLRIQFYFFFPQQLAAFHDHPTLISASYNLFVAGNIALWPAIITLARLIGEKKPGWALWGGTFVMFGLFARTFHAGVDFLAFQLVPHQSLESATRAVAGAYGAFYIVSALIGLVHFGWIILAIGSYLSGTLGILRAIALGLMGALMGGILKGSSAMSVVFVSGLCVALVPLGVAILRTPPAPKSRTVLAWTAGILILTATLFVLGQLG